MTDPPTDLVQHLQRIDAELAELLPAVEAAVHAVRRCDDEELARELYDLIVPLYRHYHDLTWALWIKTPLGTPVLP